MRRRFFQYFSIITLALAVGWAPVLACACQTPPAQSHACCPNQDTTKQTPSETQSQPVPKKQACCEIDSAPAQKVTLSILEEAPTLLPLGLVPEFNSTVSKITLKLFPRMVFNVQHSSSQVFLKHHSLLL